MKVAVVVVAGGAGRRFGGDKLAAPVGGGSLLARTLDGVLRIDLAPHEIVLPVMVVGPARPDLADDDRLRFTVEQPVGGGPAAGVATGVREAPEADALVVLAGDAPFAAAAVPRLLAALDHPGAQAAVGLDPAGRRQHLTLIVRAGVLDTDLDRTGRPARSLLDGLDVVEVPVSARESLDVDDRDALEQARAEAADADA